MSAGQTFRSSLRPARVRLVLGATAAAAVLALGGAFTAQAANDSVPAPKLTTEQVRVTDECAEPDPVDAVPGDSDSTPARDAKDATVDYHSTSGDPVDAVPGDVCAEPEPGDDPVEAEPDGNDVTPDRNAKDATVDLESAPAKR
jgi:coproporphyrinogen III oxidase